MADTARPYDALQALYPDNTNGEISPQDLRDLVKTLEPIIRGIMGGAGGDAPMGIVLYGPDAAGQAPAVLRLVLAPGQSGNLLELVERDGGMQAWIDGSAAFRTKKYVIISGNGNAANVWPSMLSVVADIPGPCIELKVANTLNAFALGILGKDGVERARVTEDGEYQMAVAGKGPILRSPNGHRWRLTIGDAGAATWTDLDAPVGPPSVTCTFTQADNASVLPNWSDGAAWVQWAGTWGTKSNRGYVSANGQAALSMAVRQYGTAIARLTARRPPYEGDNQLYQHWGLVGRAVDANNYYRLNLTDPGTVTLQKITAGAFGTVQSVTGLSFAINDLWVWEIDAAGTHTVKQNGVTVLTATEATHQGTYFGMVTQGGGTFTARNNRWDDMGLDAL